MKIVMGHKARLKHIKKINRKKEAKIISMFRNVQVAAEELRSLAKYEEEFGARESDVQQQVMSQAKKSATDLRVYEQDFERKAELGKCHSKVDDDCQDHRN